MAENKNINNAKPEGRKEPAYPLYPLDEALKIAEAVKDMGGSRSPVSKALLAKHLKYAETGPSFVQRIAAAKSYRLIDGWGSYSLTEESKRYFYPMTEVDKMNASLSFLSAPPPFDLLIKRFDGEKLPSNEMLGNVLHQDAGIPVSWKGKLASMFIRSAQFIGILDSQGILRHDATGQSAPAHSPMPEGDESRLDQPSFTVRTPDSESRRQADVVAPGHTLWTFRHKGSHIRLETPEDMPKELWEKLNAYVQQVLKPTNESDPK